MFNNDLHVKYHFAVFYQVNSNFFRRHLVVKALVFLCLVKLFIMNSYSSPLFIGFVKVIMYIVFVLIMMRVYTLPLFAFRPMYYAARSFRKALKDVINSRRAIHHLNNSFPDATSDELTEADNVCIICREEMQSGEICI